MSVDRSHWLNHVKSVVRTVLKFCQPTTFLKGQDMQSLPNGLQYFPEIISADNERELLDQVMRLPLATVKKGGRVAKRKMACFGWDYHSTRKTISSAPQIPDYLQELLRTASKYASIDPKQFEQAIVTWYPPGYGIGRHPDAAVFGDTVMGVSLATTATMKFYLGDESYSQTLDPRSMILMAGESRWVWEHEVVGRSVKAVRWSVTFRTVLESAKVTDW